MSSLISQKVEKISFDGGGGTTLAAVECLAIPLVEEVVLMADIRCSRCQERVAHIITKIKGDTESLVISVLEKKVTVTFTHPNSNVDRFKP